MTRDEHLLTILVEECGEVAQRVSKLLRFGRDEVQPGQPRNNAERVMVELADLLAVVESLQDARILPYFQDDYWFNMSGTMRSMMDAKQEKVEKFLKFSAGCGLVSDMPADPVPHPEAQG